MKKIICILLTLGLLVSCIFAETYKATTKGEVFIKTEDGEMVPLEAEDSVTEDDVIIIIEEKASITLIIKDTKVIIRKPGTYKVSDIIKKVQ